VSRKHGGIHPESTKKTKFDVAGKRIPKFIICHRWFQSWCRQGVFRQILIELGEDLYKRGAIEIRETLIDSSFSPVKEGGIMSIN
jgi:hypothetical protein